MGQVVLPGEIDNRQPAASCAAERIPVMEKAHLYEALYLVNHGIDEAVRGVQRLKKSPKLFMEAYHKSMAGLERRRAMRYLSGDTATVRLSQLQAHRSPRSPRENAGHRARFGGSRSQK
jgi:hypothetical protein